MPGKYFIITIDTEGDNLWQYRLGDVITTKNSHYIPRFHDLCKKYHFKPVYLTNYEMAADLFLIEYLKDELKNNSCEIGIHPHAWNTPPIYDLPFHGSNYGLPYLIEYPENIMKDKFHYLMDLLTSSFETRIYTHRSGRWVMNDIYYSILSDHNILVDCSVTPHISWKHVSGFTRDDIGTDYTNYPETPYWINNNLLEIPVSIRFIHYYRNRQNNIRSFLSAIKRYIKGAVVWLRPNGNNLDDMLTLIELVKRSNSDYLMFMLHSSELMPGGSPVFGTEKSIEILYEHLNAVFQRISNYFTGITLFEYYSKYKTGAAK